MRITLVEQAVDLTESELATAAKYSESPSLTVDVKALLTRIATLEAEKIATEERVKDAVSATLMGVGAIFSSAGQTFTTTEDGRVINNLGVSVTELITTARDGFYANELSQLAITLILSDFAEILGDKYEALRRLRIKDIDETTTQVEYDHITALVRETLTEISRDLNPKVSRLPSATGE